MGEAEVAAEPGQKLGAVPQERVMSRVEAETGVRRLVAEVAEVAYYKHLSF